jgi:hypothetical protein
MLMQALVKFMKKSGKDKFIEGVKSAATKGKKVIEKYPKAASGIAGVAAGATAAEAMDEDDDDMPKKKKKKRPYLEE